MTEHASAPDAARLDELAAVTREYARYSRTMSGLGDALVGTWMIAAAWVTTGVSATGGELLFVAAPLASLALFRVAGRYYQRHGEVLEEELAPSFARPLLLFNVFLFSVVSVLMELNGTRGRSAVVTVFVVAAAVATPMLALRLGRGFRELSTTMILAMLATQLRHGSSAGVARSFLWGSAAFGLLLILSGGVVHFRYRRLERRLSALKEGA